MTRAKDLDELLRDERQVEPPTGLEEKLWSDLQRRAALGPPAHSDVDLPPDPFLRSPLLKVIVGLALLVGAGVFGASQSYPATPAFERMRTDAPIVSAAPPEIEAFQPVRPVAPPAPLVAQAPAVTPPRSDARPRRAPRLRKPAATTSVDDSETSELELILAIRDAVRRSDRPVALVRVQEHERRYGDEGRFTQERLAYHVEVLCALGEAQEARSIVAEFLARWPDSAHLPRLHRSCGAPLGLTTPASPAAPLVSAGPRG